MEKSNDFIFFLMGFFGKKFEFRIQGKYITENMKGICYVR